MNDKKRLGIGIGGTIVAAICCFTPFLVVFLGAVGLSAWLVWLDYVLLPILALFVAYTIYALIRRRRSSASDSASSMTE